MKDTLLGVFRRTDRTGFQLRGNRLYRCEYRKAPNPQGKMVEQWVPVEWVPASALAEYEPTDVAGCMIADAVRLEDIETPPR